MPYSGESDPQKKKLLAPSFLLIVIGINIVFLFYVQTALGLMNLFDYRWASSAGKINCEK